MNHIVFVVCFSLSKIKKNYQYYLWIGGNIGWSGRGGRKLTCTNVCTNNSKPGMMDPGLDKLNVYKSV